MATEALVQKVKQLIALGKAGKVDEAYAGYKELFLSPEFATYPVEERRHAIRLVVNIKVPPNKPSAAMVAAYKAASVPLEVMLASEDQPADYELLGICCLIQGDEKRAGQLFRDGLTKERALNAQSPLCGSLMKWVAAV